MEVLTLLGLKYLGNREEGISLLLYRSYKTVSVVPKKPYRFTERDNTTQEARHYYEGLGKLGVSIIDSEEDFKVNAAPAARTQKLEAEVDKQIDVQTPIPTEEDKRAAAESIAQLAETDANSDNGEPRVVSEEIIPSAVDSSLFADMSDAELSEYMEMNYDKDQLKDLISQLGLDINVSRKSENTLISDLVSNHKAELVAHLSK